MSFLIPALFTCITTFIITPVAMKLAFRFRLVDNSHTRKHPARVHVGTVPRAGGLALYVSVILASIMFLPLSKPILGILLACTLTTGIGLIDDARELSPYLRFIGNLITSTIIVGSGIGIPFITNPFNGVIQLDSWRLTFTIFDSHSIVVWSSLFAIIWLTWTMNIIGWSSGIDGQMPGFVAIAATVLGILSLRFSAHDISQTIVATLAFIAAGAYIGFIPWNFYPQKIMPGYSGKSLAGLLLGTLAILSGGKVGSALLILAVPMLDAGYTLVRRLAKGRSPFVGDRKHLHHRLLDLGWSKRRIAIFYWVVTAFLGIMALTLTSQQKLFAFIAVGVIIIGALLWFSYALKQVQQTQK